MKGLVKKAVAERLRGERPSPVRAVGVAITVGVSAGVIAYKLMRAAE